MSKSSAKTPPPAKPAAKRKAVKPVPAPAPKAPAKKAAPVTTAKKSAHSPAPAAPAATKPAAKPVPKSAAKAAAAPAAAKAAPSKVVAPPKLVAVSKPAAEPKAVALPKPVAAPKPPAKAAPAPKSSNKPGIIPVPSVPPVPINRFSERFSPPKPPSRGYPEPMETVKPAVKADPKLINAWKTKAGRDLTEPELMAMPEAEYMNEKQLEFFRARLQALKDDLLSNAGETTEHLREDTSIVPDPADRATIEEEHALELRTRDRERKLLKKISQSLTRIDSGDYGFCDETGEPIGLGRLLARPTATLSLEAQQRREMKQKMFGD
ncbi:MAG: RNA polymerase-binding protein DksA [Ideonella sp.]|nr:RNA polymerase-binding protein DksA [Ideonella sp.]MBL0148742.1 RNA polymerase-binding protein DksA [Ideonella sp.]